MSQPEREATRSPRVEISTSGRGGSISYIEADHRVEFTWEFALPPAIALVFGPGAAGWDAAYPWAGGRQESIYEFVGEEVVRQQVSAGSFEMDLEQGVLEILRARADRRGARSPIREPSGALAQFKASAVPPWKEWNPGEHYDLESLAALPEREIGEAIALLTSRDVTWREVEALARLDSPAARTALQQALQHHLRIDTRLAAAEVMKRQDAGFDLDGVLARQIRKLHRPTEGLERALRLAEASDSPVIRQALLWASYNATDCAPACAALLLRLSGAAAEPFDDAVRDLLAHLGVHNSSFERDAAFRELSQRVEMVLDQGAAD